MFKLRVKKHFDAAHCIADYAGKCSRMHGHRWDVEVVIVGNELNSLNILADFADIKQKMKYFINQLDHYILNAQLDEDNLTAEYLARWFYNGMTEKVRRAWPHVSSLKVLSVGIWESPECCVEYDGQ